MIYEKEIGDSILIQFIILHTLNKCDRPIAYDDLLNLVLDNCNIVYSDFQVALDNLVKTEHIQTFLEGTHKQIYAVTQKGANAADFFRTRIPVYIREPIEVSIKELFRTERMRNSVRGAVAMLRHGEYTAECALYDDDNTCLMNISLYSGSREQAEANVRYFKENSDIVYSRIITAFSGGHEQKSTNTKGDIK